MVPVMKTSALAAALAALLLLAACGDDKETEAEPALPLQTAVETPDEGAPAATDAADLAKEIPDDLDEKPTVPAPSGEAPTELETIDIVKGKGRTAKKGDEVSMQYVGVSWSSGEQFDASWDRGEPFTFTIGEQMVIAGWDEGIPGMKEGGRRLLVIPPDKGYGPAGQGPIGPNETLVFVVDLEKVG